MPLWTARVTKTAKSAERFTSLEQGIIPWWQDWAPLIVIGNCKSGNGDGALLMSEMRRLLNPFQVADLSETSPDVVLSWIKRVRPVKINLLVAGGDGTVAWILNTIQKMQLMVKILYLFMLLATKTSYIYNFSFLYILYLYV